MNLPNKLTLLRIALVPVFVIFLMIDSIPYGKIWAILVFAIASLTDMLDGRIARKHGLVTDFGKFADPVADKILTMAAFICFVSQGWAYAALVILILAREFIVTSIRLVAAGGGTVIAANRWGKAKTISQIITILLIMVLQVADGWLEHAYLTLFWWIGAPSIARR